MSHYTQYILKSIFFSYFCKLNMSLIGQPQLRWALVLIAISGWCKIRLIGHSKLLIAKQITLANCSQTGKVDLSTYCQANTGKVDLATLILPTQTGKVDLATYCQPRLVSIRWTLL